ncbi:MAG: hypothetical protein AAF985_23530 [Bacteroidota bacterium]
MEHQKVGGIAGILEAILYIIGMAFLFLFLSPVMEETSSDLEKLSFILENKALFQIWHLLIYVLFGLLLLPLTVAINQQFKTESLIANQVTPVLGFIWSGLVISSGMINNVGLETVNDLFAKDPSSALTTWKIIGSIQNGLGGGVEVVGGVWVLLISIYGLKARIFPRLFNCLGLIVGGAGILTVIPGWQDFGLIFGLSQIMWFAWIGSYLLKSKKSAPGNA